MLGEKGDYRDESRYLKSKLGNLYFNQIVPPPRAPPAKHTRRVTETFKAEFTNDWWITIAKVHEIMLLFPKKSNVHRVAYTTYILHTRFVSPHCYATGWNSFAKLKNFLASTGE